MENNITNGSKLIAEYLGWKYIPFNDLQGLKKAGWYEFVPRSSTKEEVTVTSSTLVGGEKTEEKVENKLINMDFFRYNTKNGWISKEDGFYRYVCRNHSDLRFYNSMDILLPVIKKIEKETNGDLTFFLLNGGCSCNTNYYKSEEISYNFDEKLSWVQNTFLTVVETIKYIKDGRAIN